MGLNLDQVNNLYTNRYAFTLNAINYLQNTIDNGDYKNVLDSGDKLAVFILNKMLDENQ